jgi:hypothetical protein
VRFIDEPTSRLAHSDPGNQMERLVYVLYQIDEAKRYIQGGRLEQLRLALLLLDNAAEIQLERRVRDELVIEELRERVRSQALGIGDPGLLEKVADLVAWQPLTSGEKRRLERDFNAKLDYLSARHGLVDDRLVRILRRLHRYRNDAYHRARVRRETVRTAACLFLEVDCQLLSTLFRVSSWSSGDDYPWLEERFGLKKPYLIAGASKLMIDDLRAGIIPSVDSVKKNLSEHLAGRIADIWDALDFVIDNSGIESRGEALQVAQAMAAVGRGELNPPPKNPWMYKAKWSISTVEALDDDISTIGGADDRLYAFASFSQLEERLEPIESEVDDLVGLVDRMVQDEIDRRRGK